MTSDKKPQIKIIIVYSLIMGVICFLTDMLSYYWLSLTVLGVAYFAINNDDFFLVCGRAKDIVENRYGTNINNIFGKKPVQVQEPTQYEAQEDTKQESSESNTKKGNRTPADKLHNKNHNNSRDNRIYKSRNTKNSY